MPDLTIRRPAQDIPVDLYLPMPRINGPFIEVFSATLRDHLVRVLD